MLTRWVKNEERCRRELRPVLRNYLGLIRTAHNYTEYAIAACIPKVSESNARAPQVATRLLVKASNELRLITHSVLSGYMLQALGTASVLYEHCHAVSFIGVSEERARKWEAHADWRQSYPSSRERRDAVRATLSVNPLPPKELAKEVDAQERRYQLFCAAKHGNPQILAGWGIASTEAGTSIITGPMLNEKSEAQARSILYQSARLLILGATVHLSLVGPKETRSLTRAWKRLTFWRGRIHAARMPHLENFGEKPTGT